MPYTEPVAILVLCRIKGKIHTITCHEDPGGEQMRSSTLSLTSALDGEGMLNAKPLPLYPQEHTVRITVGPHGISGRARKISPQPEFDPWSVQDVATRHTGWQPYTELGTEMYLAGLAEFLAHLFEKNRLRRHGVMPNNPWHVEGEYFWQRIL